MTGLFWAWDWVSSRKLWMDGEAGFPYLAASHFNAARYAALTRGVTRGCSLHSQGFVFVLSQDLVVGLQSKPERREQARQSVSGGMTAVWSIPENKRSSLDLLVKEIFVHNSWDVQQGVPHPKERVFTVQGQKQIVSLGLPLIKSALTRLWSDGSSQCRFDLPAIVLEAVNE